MRAHEIEFEHIILALANKRLTLWEALDVAYAMGRTGIPDHYHKALGVEEE